MYVCVCAFLPVVLNGEHEKSLAASRQSEQLFSLFESAASVMNCLRVEEMVVEEKGGLRDGHGFVCPKRSGIQKCMQYNVDTKCQLKLG